ncbi:hypothetical protein ACFSKI_02765 [Pseudogracilibacillus auburnensis]|nr:hypothetical protein [Pseudogracilibacillus auburnensis]MBO1005360.1 hypothetical protein [Pseudogracilibacillus auburnensis]
MTNNKKRHNINAEHLMYEDYANLDDERRYDLVENQLELMSPHVNHSSTD